VADEKPFGRLDVPSVSATGTPAGTSSNRGEAARIASRWTAVVSRAPEATLAERATGPPDCTDARTPPGPLGGPRRLAALPVARTEAVRLADELTTPLVVSAGDTAGAGVAGGLTGAGAAWGGAGESFRVTWPSGCGGAGSEETFGGSTGESFGGSVLGAGVGGIGAGTVSAGFEGAGALDGRVGAGTERCGEGCKGTSGTTVPTVSAALDTFREGDGTTPFVAVSTAPVTAVGSDGAA
jgi:hypothetical protein